MQYSELEKHAEWFETDWFDRIKYLACITLWISRVIVNMSIKIFSPCKVINTHIIIKIKKTNNYNCLENGSNKWIISFT